MAYTLVFVRHRKKFPKKVWRTGPGGYGLREEKSRVYRRERAQGPGQKSRQPGMAAFISGVICAYLIAELLVPALKAARARDLAERQEKLYLTKLRIIRKYYPELEQKTYSEIVEHYDVETLWNNIGTHPRNTVTFFSTT